MLLEMEKLVQSFVFEGEVEIFQNQLQDSQEWIGSLLEEGTMGRMLERYWQEENIKFELYFLSHEHYQLKIKVVSTLR